MSADLASTREEIALDGTMGAMWYLGMYDGDITSGDFSSWLATLSCMDGTPLLEKRPFIADVTAKAVTDGMLVTSGMDGRPVLPADPERGKALLSDLSSYAY